MPHVCRNHYHLRGPRFAGSHAILARLRWKCGKFIHALTDFAITLINIHLIHTYKRAQT